jgi:hypothetical protein
MATLLGEGGPLLLPAHDAEYARALSACRSDDLLISRPDEFAVVVAGVVT